MRNFIRSAMGAWLLIISAHCISKTLSTAVDPAPRAPSAVNPLELHEIDRSPAANLRCADVFQAARERPRTMLELLSILKRRSPK